MEPTLTNLLLAVVTALTTALGGERVYQGMRAKRNGYGPLTRTDLKRMEDSLGKLTTSVDTLAIRFERHVGQHEGLNTKS